MSKDSEQSDLPVGWFTSTLGKVAKWGSGGTPKAKNPAFYDGDIPWAVIGDLNDGLVTATATSITRAGLEASSAKLIPAGTLLIAMYGSIGKLGIAGVELATNQAIAFATPNEQIVTSRFLFNYLACQKEKFLSSGKGMTQQNISQTILKSWPIPLPPLEEQEKIVEILEEQLSRLDAALASIRAAREKSARFRRSLLHAAFTGELTGHDTSDGTLPVGWKRGTIAQVAEVVAGRTPTKFEQRLAGSTVENRNVPFYKVGDMNSAAQYLREARVYFAEHESGSFGIEILPVGTVIFPKAGSAIATNKKRVLEVPGAIDLNCMGVSSNGVLLPQLLYWFFESFNLSSIADGSVLPQIGKKKVSSIEICYPESEFEQRKLLEDIEASVSRSDAVARMSEAIEQKAAALRRSLLHTAFSGDLTKEWREGAHV